MRDFFLEPWIGNKAVSCEHGGGFFDASSWRSLLEIMFLEVFLALDGSLAAHFFSWVNRLAVLPSRIMIAALVFEINHTSTIHLVSLDPCDPIDPSSQVSFL